MHVLYTGANSIFKKTFQILSLYINYIILIHVDF